jgi:hypothetical protein
LRVLHSDAKPISMILTAKTGSEDLVTVMKAGADDYVTKPIKSQKLRFRLAAACRILDLEEQRALSVGARSLGGMGLACPRPIHLGRWRFTVTASSTAEEDLPCAGEVYSFPAHPAPMSPGMLREMNYAHLSVAGVDIHDWPCECRSAATKRVGRAKCV